MATGTAALAGSALNNTIAFVSHQFTAVKDYFCSSPDYFAAAHKLLLTKEFKAIISFTLFSQSADIAQLVELLICNQWVLGSSPSVGTI